MELPEVGTVAFVIVLVAFFNKQFELQGNKSLLAAFVVALVFGFAPLVSELLPTIAPFIAIFLQTLLLTIAASGGNDFVMKVAQKISGVKTPTTK
jgi:hypothetical protein